MKNPENSNISERTRTAYHEAGHTIMAIINDVEFIEVTIIPDEENFGILWTKIAEDFNPDGDTGDKLKSDCEKQVQVSLGGFIAEKILTGQEYWKDASVDLQKAEDLGNYVTCDNKALSAYIGWQMEATRCILQEKLTWIKVEHLAKALLDRGTLNYDEVMDVVRAASPRPDEPLIEFLARTKMKN